MGRKTSSLLVSISLVAVLLFIGACTFEQLGQNTHSSTTGTSEEDMDPSIEHDAQMIVDALSLPESYRDNAIWSVKSLRDLGVGSFVSFTVIEDELEDVHRIDRLDYLVDLVDDSGTSYFVYFTEHCSAFTFIPPDGVVTKVIIMPAFF